MKKLTYKKFTKKISNTKQQLINLLTLPDKLNSLESKLESKLQSKLESINSTLQLLDAKMRLLDTKMEQIVSEHLEQKLTDTITASQNQNDLNLIFNSISDKFSKLIIAKEQILPEKGLENRQAHLIMRLSDKSNEFAAYNQLPIETLISYADGKTAVSCHYINVFNSFAKENGIEICDGGMIAAELPMRLAGTDTLIVSNPVMSALILSTPSLLAELARKLSKRLILAVRVSNEIISTTWDGFSEVEETERIYRWAEGSSRTARIQLNNSTNEPVRVELAWDAHSYCGFGMLEAICNGQTIQAELDAVKTMQMSVTLLPGNSDLNFTFHGQAQRPPSDFRILSFGIIDLKCRANEIDIRTHSLYYNNFPADLQDTVVRKALHKNGFFDVKATAFSNHGLSRYELPISRYRYPIGHVIDSSVITEIRTESIVAYSAYRLKESEGLSE